MFNKKPPSRNSGLHKIAFVSLSKISYCKHILFFRACLMQFDNVYTSLDARLYHRQAVASLPNPQAGHFNLALAQQLQWSDEEINQWVTLINGEQLPTAADPIAMVYAGHQFGHWAGQLGDGRGLLIGQVKNQQGERVDLHLKGIGKTPYSRMGDGRAVLRSVIREYLAGHALNALHIPSSHAVGFIHSDFPVQREKIERAAIMLRTSDSHIRLGHFEWINQFAPELLAEFTEKCIEWHYPECREAAEPVLAFAIKVIQRTAVMVSHWQLVGFAHGVMNTDNLNITGSTLDFGPYGFMERFRPQWINNHSDQAGRYVYQNQPSIAHWNLWTWLNQLIALCPKTMEKDAWKKALGECLEHFEPTFLEHYQQGLAAKMGLPNFHKDSFDCGMAFLRILQAEQLDYTTSFLRLQDKNYTALLDDCIDRNAFQIFLTQYQAIREHQDIATLDATMQSTNPRYILRNHMAQTAIEQAEKGDFSEVERLFTLLSQPFTKQPDLEQPADLAPLPSDQPDVMVSCSS